MPKDAPAPKRVRTERSGARVILYDRDCEDREAIAAKLAEAEGLAFVHPFEDPNVIAGQGTVGLEITDDCTLLHIVPEIVLVPCSGGGLSAGVSLAITEIFQMAAVYVAEPVGFDDYGRSLASGALQRNAALSGSVCDALLSPAPGRVSWQINSRRLAGGVVASDSEALFAVGFAFDELRLVVEPGGAVALAALLAGRLQVANRTVVVVLSGGNVADATLAEALRVYRSGKPADASS
jgi:threonine dehydratase